MVGAPIKPGRKHAPAARSNLYQALVTANDSGTLIRSRPSYESHPRSLVGPEPDSTSDDGAAPLPEDYFRAEMRPKRLLRSDILPVSFGFPFGFSVAIPPNLSLPAKIVTQALKPIDIAAQFGENPEINEVERHLS